MMKIGLRTLRFKLSTLFLALTALCVLIGWRSYDIAARRRAFLLVEQLNGEVIFESRTKGRPAWLSSWLFDRPVYMLDLSRTVVVDDDLRLLKALSEVNQLNLASTDVTDEGMRALAGFPELESLSLRETWVTTSGLSYLAKLADLQTLDLRGAEVADDAVVHLRVLPQLQSVQLEGTDFTDDGVLELRRSMPHLTVKRRASDLVLWIKSDAPMGSLAGKVFESVKALENFVGKPDRITGDVRQEWSYTTGTGPQVAEVSLRVRVDARSGEAQLLSPYFRSESALKGAIGSPPTIIGAGEVRDYEYDFRDGRAYVKVYAPRRGGAFILDAKKD